MVNPFVLYAANLGWIPSIHDPLSINRNDFQSAKSGVTSMSIAKCDPKRRKKNPVILCKENGDPPYLELEKYFVEPLSQIRAWELVIAQQKGYLPCRWLTRV